MKNVLVAPLDWGMGHATRCIPIIKNLIQNNHNVIIASSSEALKLLKSEFPQLTFVELPEYNPTYAANNKFILHLALQSPRIIRTIFREHNRLKKIINKFHIDLIISDNRFGIYSSTIPSIFISHQIDIKLNYNLKLLEKPLNYINRFYIKKHNECWVPDFEGKYNLTGSLSSNGIKKKRYIGPLSRFEKFIIEPEFDIMVLLSGQEPQRSSFEKILVDQLKKTDKKVLLIRGSFRDDLDEIIVPNIEIVKFLNSSVLNKKICSSGIVISRSGYSSIMDFIKLGKDAILIPTPGQTEQEYLGEYLMKKKYFYVMNENIFDLEKALEASKNYHVPEISNTEWFDIGVELERALRAMCGYDENVLELM